tara:strand:- start:414 stop:608 length:195 start_codon:yes stop_codon:yes gene_type:complete
MNNFFGFLGGRKMFFALILTVVVSTFLFLDKCDFAQWSNFVIWIFGTYAIGNGIAHIGDGMKGK